MRISYGQDVKRSALVLLKVPCWFHTYSGLVSWSVYWVKRKDRSKPARFLIVWEFAAAVGFFSKDSCSQAKSAYKAVAGVNDPGYSTRTLTLQCTPALVIVSLSLSRHTPADDHAVVPGWHDTKGVVGQREELLRNVHWRRRARRRGVGAAVRRIRH